MARALSILETTPPMLEQVGFQLLVYEDFYDTLFSIIRNIVSPDSEGNLLTSNRLLQQFQIPEGIFTGVLFRPTGDLIVISVSNSIVVYLRMLTVSFTIPFP